MEDTINIDGTEEIESNKPKTYFDLEEDQKRGLISQLIVESQRLINMGDPTLAILVPVGGKDEIEAAWNGEMLNILTGTEAGAQIAEEDHPDHKLFFPTIQEDPNVHGPMLFKASDNEFAQLREYFSKVVQLSGVDTSKLMTLNVTIECLKSFYLIAEILMPAIAKINQPQSNIIRPESGLLLPN
jgi:hypothetical protein